MRRPAPDLAEMAGAPAIDGLPREPGGPDEEAASTTGAGAAPGLAALADLPTPEMIRDLLHEVIDPELGVDIVELGLLRRVTIEGDVAKVVFTLTTPACPLSSYIEDEIRACLWQLPGLGDIEVTCELSPPWSPEEMSDVARAALGWSG